MSRVLDDLRAARDLLINVGWTQGTYAKWDPKTDAPSCYCSFGAVNQVTFGNPWGNVPSGQSFVDKLHRKDPVVLALSRAVPREYKYHIALYNDQVLETADDAIAFFDKAIELQAQKEAIA